MRSQSGVNGLPSEKYECHHCEREFDAEDVQDTWKCPVCNSFIHVYAEDQESKTRIVLLRKPANEIEEGDLVHLPGGQIKKCYRVIGVSKRKNKLGIGLEGYGQYLVDPNYPINIRTGAW